MPFCDVFDQAGPVRGKIVQYLAISHEDCPKGSVQCHTVEDMEGIMDGCKDLARFAATSRYDGADADRARAPILWSAMELAWRIPAGYASDTRDLLAAFHAGELQWFRACLEHRLSSAVPTDAKEIYNPQSQQVARVWNRLRPTDVAKALRALDTSNDLSNLHLFVECYCAYNDIAMSDVAPLTDQSYSATMGIIDGVSLAVGGMLIEGQEIK